MNQILTSHGVIARDAVIRDRILLDNSHERTLNLEYRLKAPMRMPDGKMVFPDEIIKRSAHVRLKEWPSGMDAHIAEALNSLGRQTPGFRPSNGDPYKSFLRRMGHAFRFANTQAMCNSFKMEILNGSHALGTQAANGTRTVTTKDTFKMALFKVTGSLDKAVTAYNVGAAAAANELAATGNYSAGGNAITNATVPALDGDTAHWTPSASVSWAALTSSAAFDCGLLYNTAATGSLSVAVFTFGSQSVTAGTFTLTMPTNNGTTGLIRIA